MTLYKEAGYNEIHLFKDIKDLNNSNLSFDELYKLLNSLASNSANPGMPYQINVTKQLIQSPSAKVIKIELDQFEPNIIAYYGVDILIDNKLYNVAYTGSAVSGKIRRTGTDIKAAIKAARNATPQRTYVFATSKQYSQDPSVTSKHTEITESFIKELSSETAFNYTIENLIEHIPLNYE